MTMSLKPHEKSTRGANRLNFLVNIDIKIFSKMLKKKLNLRTHQKIIANAMIK